MARYPDRPKETYELKHNYTMTVLHRDWHKGKTLRIDMDGERLYEIDIVRIMWHRSVIEKLEKYIYEFYPTNLKKKQMGDQLLKVEDIAMPMDALNSIVDRVARKIRREEQRERENAEEEGWYD
jgi:hypothetical protein